MHAKPKKSLGQNFLVDKNIQRKIIDSIEFKSNDTVLEIGAGRGELTWLIAKTARYVYALEIDSDLCQTLKINLKRHSNVKIINKDILKFNLSKYFGKTAGKIKIFGNIPYYISSPIIEHILKFKDKIDSMFITVQKEFGKRVVAAAGSKDYSSFSCFVQYHSLPKILFTIKKGSFFPVPKVDSCLLRLDIRGLAPVEIKDEGLFFKVIRASFNKRRKTLRNSLSGIIPKQKLDLFFTRFGMDPNIRPEQLSLSDFANLINI